MICVLLQLAGVDWLPVGPITKSLMSRRVDVVANPMDRAVAECHYETSRMRAAEIPDVGIARRILQRGVEVAIIIFAAADIIPIQPRECVLVVTGILAILIVLRRQIVFTDEISVTRAIGDFGYRQLAVLQADSGIVDDLCPILGIVSLRERGRLTILHERALCRIYIREVAAAARIVGANYLRRRAQLICADEKLVL